jgi:hypothetical protein
MADYSRMSREEIERAAREKIETANQDAMEADQGWSKNVEWVEKNG